MNWYNEIDRYAAQWLRNQIEAGQLAPGAVDERDIRDVRPAELVSFDECHFFCGVGIWPRAIRLAERNSNRRLARPVWTGSCPCQPFSQAGRGEGFDDERHLWPAWDWLIGQSTPGVILGEQVEGPDGLMWLDLVFSDLEARGYACGATVFPAAGVGAPHIRSRTYWVADPEGERHERGMGGTRRARLRLAHDGAAGGLADADGGNAGAEGLQRGGQHRQLAPDGGAGGVADAGQGGRALKRPGRLHADRPPGHDLARRSEDGGLADADLPRRQPGQDDARGEAARDGARRQGSEWELGVGGVYGRSGPVNGFWRASDWLYCRDGFWRPVEPGSFPLAHGVPARTGRLRAYGNAICLPQATAFIEEILMMEAFNE